MLKEIKAPISNLQFAQLFDYLATEGKVHIGKMESVLSGGNSKSRCEEDSEEISDCENREANLVQQVEKK
jgi:hypothetical protein